MSSINYQSIEKLESNDIQNYKDGVQLLLKLLTNVINEPENQKFRTIRLENKTVKERLLNLTGMKDLLVEIGFEETNGQLSLQSNILMARLKKYIEYLRKRLDLMCNMPGPSNVLKNKVESPVNMSKVDNITREKRSKLNFKPFHERIAFPKVITFPSIFLQNLEVISDTVMQYEDEKLLEYGLQFIPIESLKEKTLNNLKSIQKLIQSGKFTDPEPCYDDLLIYELAEWFKSTFFRWVNTLPCKVCKNENTQSVGTVTENGVRIEKYLCCHTISEFHRYNDIEKLLITKSGRCGEWANCFTFFCRCLKYDTRYIYSTSDHVWTEVYSHYQKRWIHVDPSENVIDSPLMYEHGWNRELSYVFAFANDHVQDVTWRYSNNHKAILKRRTSCTERQLLDGFSLLNQKRQSDCSDQRKKYLKRRTLVELVNLMRELPATESEKKGRSSGSLAWRLQRGEQNNNFYVFSLAESEIENKKFNFKYSCAQNSYERYRTDDDDTNNIVLEKNSNWDHCVYLSKNIFRNDEHDWKMVYLARMEDTDEAFIQWKFDFSTTRLKIKHINIKMETKTYENGVIDVQYLNEKDEKYSSMAELIGKQVFSIRAHLSGGKNNCAWQHTQLFRQPKNGKDYPFEIKIEFE